MKDTETGETKEIALSGVFLAIGHIPNTDPFKGTVDMDENGYTSALLSCIGVFINISVYIATLRQREDHPTRM